MYSQSGQLWANLPGLLEVYISVPFLSSMCQVIFIIIIKREMHLRLASYVVQLKFYNVTQEYLTLNQNFTLAALTTLDFDDRKEAKKESHWRI